MAQLSLTGAQLGETHHGTWLTPIFAGVAARMRERLIRSRFDDPFVNLPFPSALRVVWGGIALNNGATLIPIIVVVKDDAGRTGSELVSAPIS